MIGSIYYELQQVKLKCSTKEMLSGTYIVYIILVPNLLFLKQKKALLLIYKLNHYH